MRGAPTYVDALAALEAFEHEVEELCKKAYSRNQDRLLATMGLDNGGDCEPYKDSNPEERWAVVGIRRGTGKKGIKGPCFHVYIWFGESEDDTSEMYGTVWLDFPGKKERDEIYDKIRTRNPHCGIKPIEDAYWALTLDNTIKPNDLTAVSDGLDKLLSDWTGYCQSIGFKTGGG